MRFAKLLMVVLGATWASDLVWGLPPREEAGRAQREVVRILLDKVQVGDTMVQGMAVQILRFAGDGKRGPAFLMEGSGKVRVAGKEDTVWLSADSASAFAGQWRKLSSGEVMQVPVKVVVLGQGTSGALVVWQRQGHQEARFVSDEAREKAQGLPAAQALAAPQPNLPSSEYIVDFYADPYFTEWVGSFIRLCNGATAREGVQDGFSKVETTSSCDLNNPWEHLECWQYIGWDEDGDGRPEQFIWFQVNCPPRFPW